MDHCKQVAAGVFIWLTFGSVAKAAPHETRPAAPWISQAWYLQPTDFCRHGGHTICEVPLRDEKSEPNIQPGVAPIPLKPETVNLTPPPFAGRYPGKTTFLILSAFVYTAAWIDMHETCQFRKTIIERNPFVRPLLKLPAPAYYATGFALATGVNYVGLRMLRSKRFHKIWFLPQSLTIAGNIWGRATTY